MTAPTADDVRERLRRVKDPELPVVDVVELGIVRDIVVERDRVRVDLTPTYSGCPALAVIEADVAAAASEFGEVDVRIVQAPAWTTDWITDDAKRKLAAAGIAPPVGPVGSPERAPHCPRCDSPETERRSEFGATACKALWVCRTCLEPFDLLKVI